MNALIVNQLRCAALACLLWCPLVSAHAATTAFFYGAEPPVGALSLYDRVVLDARNAARADWSELATQTQVFCYLSVGERTTAAAAPQADLVIGRNEAWQSEVMDVRTSAWRKALTAQATALADEFACEGFFLDTLDSYQLALPTDQHAAAVQGLREIVLSLRRALPNHELILNRGFEFYASVADEVVGVAVESLYAGWDVESQSYREISDEERAWLLEQLASVRANGHPVTVIDYLPTSASDAERRALAERIAAHGFSPWVTDVSLTHLGRSHVTHIPREVALIYHAGTSDFAGNDAHLLLGAVLDYYGYDVRPYEIREPLPQLIQGQHAGVVTWFDGGEATRHAQRFTALHDWLANAMDDGFRVAMFGAPPVGTPALQSRMNVQLLPASQSQPAQRHRVAPGFGDFEAPAPQDAPVHLPLASTSDENRSWVSMDQQGVLLDPVLTGPWGGYAQHPYLLQEGFKNQRRWLLDPFRFIAEALQPAEAPRPDTTTEAGRRILISWIDGDGFPSRAELPGTPFSAEVLLERVFRPIKLPHTVSVVEGEVAASGLFPQLTPALEPIARQIFALPNVEIASHSYSHPFFWARRANVDVKSTLYGLGLPIPGYQTDMRREVFGSMDYIDQTLAPDGKRTEVFLWTGDAIPSAETIGYVAERGAVNLNGGNTQIRDALPSLTNVSPQSRWTSGGPQIYAPIMNENVYTNDWTGPFHGFRRVIETFKRTEQPRRLKPLGIYYHFYSGTKRGALDALLDVYRYAQSQSHHPLYASEYSRRVMGYHRALITQPSPGVWQIDQLGELRTVRIPAELGVPSLSRSDNVAGWIDSPDGRYVHLTQSAARLTLAASADALPSLVSANATPLRWKGGQDGSVAIRLKGHVPVEFEVRSDRPCTLGRAGFADVDSEPVEGGQRLRLAEHDTGDAVLSCR